MTALSPLTRSSRILLEKLPPCWTKHHLLSLGNSFMICAGLQLAWARTRLLWMRISTFSPGDSVSSATATSGPYTTVLPSADLPGRLYTFVNGSRQSAAQTRRCGSAWSTSTSLYQSSVAPFQICKNLGPRLTFEHACDIPV